ncbi:MAG: hypothetical protein OEZ14_03790 [Acidimicrobiia bacterium]|nr:hypothetical protein [Acidimicrobiia bacterium]
MARILIRPEDLARLAQRFDAAADDLARSGRRLARTRAEVRLNPADESFPGARVAERAARVEADLRRLAAEFRVDAGLMARTVDDAEFDGDGTWTLGLLAVAGPSAAAAGPGVWNLRSVVTGLGSLGAPGSPGAETPTSAGVGSVAVRPIGAGGLFADSSRGGGQALLVRLTQRLGAASVPSDPTAPAAPAGEGATGAVWSRIVGELFAVEDDP